MMAKGDPNEQIVLFHPHTNNGFFFLLTIAFSLYNKLPEVPENSERLYYMMMSL